MPAAATDSWRRFRLPLAGLTIAYTVVLVFATHYPKPEDLLGPNPPSDKTLHFLAYGLLGLLVAATLAAAGRWSPARITLMGLGLLAFAAVDEATQPMFGRSADTWDLVYDAAGLAIGIALVAVARTLVKPP